MRLGSQQKYFALTLFLLNIASMPFSGPRDIAQGFHAKNAAKRAAAAKRYAQECSGRQRHVFRRAPEGWAGYQTLLGDKESHVVLAALEMSKCFKSDKTLPLIARLVEHKNAAVMREALSRLAHFESVEAVAPFSEWLKVREKDCMAPEQNDGLDRCHLAIYGVGQSTQHTASTHQSRLQAGTLLLPFLASEDPKTRKVAATALALGGAPIHRKEVSKLIDKEMRGHFIQSNSKETLALLKDLKNKMVRSD